MDTDDLRAEISAVEQEIANHSATNKPRASSSLLIRLLVAALLLFIIVESIVHHGRSKTEADLNHMMQQAQHVVLDFQHRYGQLPPIIPNPALRPYVRMVQLGDGRFRLEGRLGDVTQEMEGP